MTWDRVRGYATPDICVLSRLIELVVMRGGCDFLPFVDFFCSVEAALRKNL